MPLVSELQEAHSAATPRYKKTVELNQNTAPSRQEARPFEDIYLIPRSEPSKLRAHPQQNLVLQQNRSHYTLYFQTRSGIYICYQKYTSSEG